MWAVVGMLNSDSPNETWGMPPVRFANHLVASSAAWMKVGLGRSGSCSVCRRTPLPNFFLTGFSRIAESSACMTSRITVRCDQCLGLKTRRSVSSGWRAIAARNLSGLVSRLPSPVYMVNMRPITSPAWP